MKECEVLNPTVEAFGETLAEVGNWFLTPIGAGLKELLEDFVPFFDILYAWAVRLTTGDASFIQEKLTFPWADIIKFIVICLIYVLITAALDKVWPMMSKSKWLRLLCAVVAVVVNAMLNYDTAQIVKYGGSELLATILSIAGKSVLVIALLIGFVLIFVNKLKDGATLGILAIKAGTEISKKTVELAVLYVSAVFIMLITEILTSNLSAEEKVEVIVYSTLGLIGLQIIHWLVDKIFSLFDAPKKGG